MGSACQRGEGTRGWTEALTGGPAGRVRVGIASLGATERWARRGNRASVALKESWAAEGCCGKERGLGRTREQAGDWATAREKTGPGGEEAG